MDEKLKQLRLAYFDDFEKQKFVAFLISLLIVFDIKC